MALSGSICALATPFRAGDGALDLDAYGRLVDRQLAGGTRAIVVAGSTGEAASLDDDEYSRLVAFAVDRVARRVPVLAGSGLPSTRKTITLTQRAVDAGVDYVLVVAPAYVRPTQEGMFRHFSEVADHARVPVVLYNVPGRTACDLRPETVARLAVHGNIAGIKEAVGDPQRVRELLGLRSSSFSVLSGDDPTCAYAQLAGADGVVSVAANVVPALFAAMCDACARRDEAVAGELDRRLQPLYDVLALEPNPIPLKWCLSRLGLGSSVLRLPLTELSPSLRGRADRVLADLGLVEDAPAVG
ncbi:4-hydroxy-tetrahydrodipicolinate synthase [Dokdonella sp.]|uniref:4-hydroxy-tetrahydrodipicolinate synthase n=1 Tax=Dokdonella sp. TaxID=2291710 RepID=UPI002F42B16B